jgi:trimeric autotransporter adhesin
MTMRVVYFLAVAAALNAGEHHGWVKFAGQGVPGATVTASQGEKRVHTVSNQEGAYGFVQLPDGPWTMRVEKLLFMPLEREVQVAPGAAATTWELELAPVEHLLKAAVAVERPAPAAASPETPRKKDAVRAANTSREFERAELRATAPRAPDEPAGAGAVAEATAGDGFLINGSVNNGAASALGQSAAFGNNRARRQKLYYGAVQLLFNTSAWNARPYSLTGQATPRADSSHLAGSLTLGGPLRIPGLIQHREPQVTMSYRWTRNRNASTASGRMPTEAERAGSFGQSVVDPASGAAFPNNAIPASRVSPQAAMLMGLYPRANFDGGASGYNYQVPLVSATHEDDLSASGGKNAGALDWVSGRFGLKRTRGDNTSLLGFLNTSRTQDVSGTLEWYHRIGMRSHATFALRFARTDERTVPYFAGRYNISAMAGITGNDQEPRNWGPPTLNFAGGISTLADGASSLTRTQTSGFAASFTRVAGTHSLTAGGEVRRQNLSLLAQQDARGTFTFTGAATGADFAGFLLGLPDASSIAFGNADKYFGSWNVAAYAGDDWRVAPALTVKWGLRWEYDTPLEERYGRLVNLDTNGGFGQVAPVVATDPRGPLSGRRYGDALVQPQKGAIQPRVGIAWRPLPITPLLVRAGYGVYYDGAVYAALARRMAQQAPLSKSLSVENSAANPLTLANGFKAVPNVTATTFGVDPEFRRGYAQNWQLTVQFDLPFSLVATGGYLGTKGTRAQQEFLPNTFAAGVVNPCAACPSGFTYLVSNGNSTRHAGQFELRRRMRSGFRAQLKYTFAKALDNAALGGQGAVIAQNWLDFSGERGRSGFDQRHVITAQAQYTTGRGLGGALRGGWAGRLMREWTAVSEVTAGSGLPLTPTYPALVSGTGYSGSVRPDYTGAALYDAPAGRRLNPAAVKAPEAGRWGNAGRNSITGPAQFSMNASVGRTFRLADGKSLDFRMDSANPLNHVTYTRWSTVVNAQFGLPVAANAMRTLQASLRVRF